MSREFSTPRDVIPAIAGRLGARHLALARLWDRWDRLVGEPLCRHCWPSHFVSRDMLVLLVSDSAWMQQISFLSERLRSLICEALGPDYMVSRLRFKIGDVAGARRRPVTETVRDWRLPAPPDEAVEEIDSMLGRMEDEKLRQAIKGLFEKSAAAERHLHRTN